MVKFWNGIGRDGILELSDAMVMVDLRKLSLIGEVSTLPSQNSFESKLVLNFSSKMKYINQIIAGEENLEMCKKDSLPYFLHIPASCYIAVRTTATRRFYYSKGKRININEYCENNPKANNSKWQTVSLRRVFV